MRLVLIMLLSITFYGSEIKDINQKSSILCIEDKSTGFKRKKNEYLYAKFQPEKYLIKKIDNTKCKSQSYKFFMFFGDSTGCYTISLFGNSESKDIKTCRELWKTENDKPLYIEEIQCEGFKNIKFKPNGNFILSNSNGDLSENISNEIEDSIFISLGKCSIID